MGAHVLLGAAHCFDIALPAAMKVNGELVEILSIVSDGSDHVLVTVSGTFKHWSHIGHGTLRQGDPVFIWGNPSFLNDQLRVGRIAGKGHLPDEYCNADPMFCHEFQFFDIASTHGDSGAAIFNRYGQIVGVVSIGTAPISDPFNLMGAIPLAFTKAQLKEAGV